MADLIRTDESDDWTAISVTDLRGLDLSKNAKSIKKESQRTSENLIIGENGLETDSPPYRIPYDGWHDSVQIPYNFELKGIQICRKEVSVFPSFLNFLLSISFGLTS